MSTTLERQETQLVIRVPYWLRAWIEREASMADRSINQQVLHILKKVAPKEYTRESS